MKWDVHVKRLYADLSKRCYMTRYLQDIMAPYVTRNIYFEYFRVHLKYGLDLWGRNLESRSTFKLQNGAI
jgi:hypothetical protein